MKSNKRWYKMKKLLCFFGFHYWWSHNWEIDTFVICLRCGLRKKLEFDYIDLEEYYEGEE